MAKKKSGRRGYRPAPQRKAGAVSRRTADQKKQARDSYNNSIARLGPHELNTMAGSYYQAGRLSTRWDELTDMYREGWLAKKIIDLPAEDMTKAWISIDSQMEQDAISRIEQEMRQYKVQRKFTEAIKWSRLYGGALAVIMIDGDEDVMDKPLDLNLVMPGSFRGLLVFDRWNGLEPSLELVDDMGDPDYGLPTYYTIENRVNYESILVHHSRVLRFVGRDLPYAEQEAEIFWGASELEHVFDELQKRNATSANIAQLVFQANLRVLKMSDLGELLALSDENTQRELYQTVQAQNMLMTSFGLQLMNAEDSLETHPYSFSGLNDIYQSFMTDIAGASDIPATKLFGKSPDGMNATGDGDLTNYYDMLRQLQENDVRPAIEKLMPVICVSALGVVPDDLEISFEPIETATAADRAELANKVATAISTLYTSDIITKEMALKEIKKQSFVTGMGSSISDSDIEDARNEDRMPPPESDMPDEGFGGFGAEQEGGDAPDRANKAPNQRLDGEDGESIFDKIDRIFGKPEGKKRVLDFKEEDHPRGPDGKFVEGGGSAGGEKDESSGNAEAGGEKRGSGSGGGQSSGVKAYSKVSPKEYHEKLLDAVNSRPVDDAWRVEVKDQSEYNDSTLLVSEEGSVAAVEPDGDIVSVCKKNGSSDRGSDILAQAVENGGNKLDAFDGLYPFYTRNGFEPVSWTPFNEEYAPDGWDKKRDLPEDVIFYKYVGKGNVKSKSLAEFKQRVKPHDEYDDALKRRDDSMG